MALSKLDQLYRQVILDHSSHPHHYGTLEEETDALELNNPTCGDVIQIQWKMKDGVISDIAFEGEGCSISKASASMMCDVLIGKTLPEAEALLEDFLSLVQGQEVENEDLEDAQLLSGVSKFPARVKCATLAWKAVELMIEKNKEGKE